MHAKYIRSTDIWYIYMYVFIYYICFLYFVVLQYNRVLNKLSWILGQSVIINVFPPRCTWNIVDFFCGSSPHFYIFGRCERSLMSIKECNSKSDLSSIRLLAWYSDFSNSKRDHNCFWMDRACAPWWRALVVSVCISCISDPWLL